MIQSVGGKKVSSEKVSKNDVLDFLSEVVGKSDAEFRLNAPDCFGIASVSPTSRSNNCHSWQEECKSTPDKNVQEDFDGVYADWMFVILDVLGFITDYFLGKNQVLVKSLSLQRMKTQ